jgi:hypothetical protein
MDLSVHRPARGGSRRTKGGPGPLPPSSGRPRRGGAAPAFVGGPTASLSAPGSCPGDWETVAANPGGPVSHEAGRLTDLRRRSLRLDKRLHLL